MKKSKKFFLFFFKERWMKQNMDGWIQHAGGGGCCHGQEETHWSSYFGIGKKAMWAHGGPSLGFCCDNYISVIN